MPGRATEGRICRGERGRGPPTSGRGVVGVPVLLPGSEGTLPARSGTFVTSGARTGGGAWIGFGGTVGSVRAGATGVGGSLTRATGWGGTTAGAAGLVGGGVSTTGAAGAG